MYTIESLKEINKTYDREHRVTQQDVDKVNGYVDLLQSTRTADKPQPGDLLRLTDKIGVYYHYARIASRKQINITGRSEIDVCHWPEAPWLNCPDPEISKYTLSICGSSYDSVPDGELTYIGTDKAYFKDWGHNGACRDGAVLFSATVNVWEYVEPNPVFPPEYTTKKWDKQTIYFKSRHKISKNDSGHTIFGNGIAFHTHEEYRIWLQTYKGVEFRGVSPDHTVVFLYRETQYYISREEWDTLDLPLDTRMCNGIILVKVRYDDENRAIHAYRFTNDGSKINRRLYCPFERAKGADLTELLELIH